MSAWQNHRQTTVRAATKLQETEKPESLAGKFPNQLTVTVQLHEMEIQARFSTRLRFHIPHVLLRSPWRPQVLRRNLLARPLGQASQLLRRRENPTTLCHRQTTPTTARSPARRRTRLSLPKAHRPTTFRRRALWQTKSASRQKQRRHRPRRRRTKS